MNKLSKEQFEVFEKLYELFREGVFQDGPVLKVLKDLSVEMSKSKK